MPFAVDPLLNNGRGNRGDTASMLLGTEPATWPLIHLLSSAAMAMQVLHPAEPRSIPASISPTGSHTFCALQTRGVLHGEVAGCLTFLGYDSCKPL